MIKIEHLDAGYGKELILRDLSLTISKGQITTLVGPNGCGKSTLLKVLTGSLGIQKGTITLNQQNLSTLSPSQRAQSIAYLPQLRSIPDMTVERLVLQGRFPYLSYPRKYRKDDYILAKQAMEALDLGDHADRSLSALSGGLRQKAYIAMALAQNAPVILMDEPTSFLDIEHQIQFMTLIRDLSAQGKTILLVLHDLLSAMKLSHQVAVMKEGRILFSGPPSEFLDNKVAQNLYHVDLKSLETTHGEQYYYDLPLN